MVDKIIELENNRKYVILDEKNLGNINYYYGLRLDKNEEPTNNYLFFQEIINNDNVYLAPIEDEKLRNTLLTTFTINHLTQVYDLGGIKNEK